MSVPTKRRIGRWHRDDVVLLSATALSSASLVWVVYYRLTPGAGGVGFVLSWFVAFVALFWFVVRQLEGPRRATDRAVTVALTGVALVLLGVLAAILGDIVVKGVKTLRPGFFFRTMPAPSAPATSGGALQSIIGTFEEVGLSLVISVPLAVLTAIYLSEIRGRYADVVRTVIDAMSGVPSIVAGLFVYAVWVLRFGFSGIAAAFALSILMVPVVTRTVEEVLRLVPGGLREASAALGSPSWRTTLRVVLPTARSGIVTATLLGVARAAGDTAALIATAVGLDTVNANPFHGQQDSLPLFVFKQVKSGFFASQTQRAYTGALVLVALVLVFFAAARIVGRPKHA